MADIQYHFGTGEGDPTVHQGQTNVDVDGDGTTDAIAVDFDGDGRYDDAMWDSDGDGVADTALLDLNDDGVAESAYHDPSGEGTWNAKGQGGAEDGPVEDKPAQQADNSDSGFENQPPGDQPETGPAGETDQPEQPERPEGEPTGETDPPAADEPVEQPEGEPTGETDQPTEAPVDETQPADVDSGSLTEWFEDLKPAEEPEPATDDTTGEPTLEDWYDDLKPGTDTTADDTTDTPATDTPATDSPATDDPADDQADDQIADSAELTDWYDDLKPMDGSMDDGSMDDADTTADSGSCHDDPSGLTGF